MGLYVTTVFRDRFSIAFKGGVFDEQDSIPDVLKEAPKRMFPKRTEAVSLSYIKLPLEPGKYHVGYSYTINSRIHKAIYGFDDTWVNLPQMKDAQDIEDLSQAIRDRYLVQKFPHATRIQVTIISIQSS